MLRKRQPLLVLLILLSLLVLSTDVTSAEETTPTITVGPSAEVLVDGLLVNVPVEYTCSPTSDSGLFFPPASSISVSVDQAVGSPIFLVRGFGSVSGAALTCDGTTQRMHVGVVAALPPGIYPTLFQEGLAVVRANINVAYRDPNPPYFFTTRSTFTQPQIIRLIAPVEEESKP